MEDVIKHYMWKDADKVLFAPPNGVDIEARFSGLRYSSCTGLNDKGKRTNIHIEKSAISETLRVWQGDEVIREATTIVFTLYFIGADRQNAYDRFCKYVSNGKIHYWDTKRKKEAYLVLVDQIKPKEDTYKGSVPYILAEFKFQNLWGECETKDITDFL
jgi:hypothetical protein